MAMPAQDIELNSAAALDDRETWLAMITGNRTCGALLRAVVPVCADCPDVYNAIQRNDPATVLIRGGSCIVDLLGQVLGDPDLPGERIRLPGGRRIILRARQDFEALGHHCRPDLFTLSVDFRSKAPVSFLPGNGPIV
jgi:nitrilase